MQFWREFAAARPLILGTLLDAVSGALRGYEDVRLERLPRMADFAQWATAAEPYLGLTKGAFMAAYTGNRAASNDFALEAAPVAEAVLSFIEKEGSWFGTSSELLKELNSRTGEDVQRQKGWPKAANALSGILKRRASNLRAAGVNVIRANRAGKNGSRIIQLERINISSSALSASSVMSNNGADSPMLSDDPSDDAITSDDLADGMSQASTQENALKTVVSVNTDDADDVSQVCSDSLSEYEPDEEELRYEAEERAAIMAESEAAQAA